MALSSSRHCTAVHGLLIGSIEPRDHRRQILPFQSFSRELKDEHACPTSNVHARGKNLPLVEHPTGTEGERSERSSVCVQQWSKSTDDPVLLEWNTVQPAAALRRSKRFRTAPGRQDTPTGGVLHRADTTPPPPRASRRHRSPAAAGRRSRRAGPRIPRRAMENSGLTKPALRSAQETRFARLKPTES